MPLEHKVDYISERLEINWQLDLFRCAFHRFLVSNGERSVMSFLPFLVFDNATSGCGGW